MIDKKYPIPEGRGEITNMLNSLEIGDSFLVKDFKEALRVRSSARYCGIKVRQKTTSDGIRIWRIG